MNNNTSVFVRGQVWYWEDPIYGAKEDGCDIDIGEQTVRYSRYCIIIQDSDTITNNSILVIPCSTKNNNPHDVQIKLAHMIVDTDTYAKVSSVFPVSPKSLTRYVCTLGNNVMNIIDAKLAKILLPFIGNNIDIPIVSKNDYYNDMDANEVATIDTNKSAEVVVETEHIDSTIMSDLNTNTLPIEVKNVPKKKNKFSTDDDMKEFIKIYLKEGIEFVANHYSIKSSTVHCYLHRFKKALNIEKCEDILDECDESNVDESSIVYVPVTDDSPQAVSKLANKIIDTLRDEKIYSYTSLNLGTTDTEFYNRLSSTIYFSLTTFLGINVFKNGQYYIPNITEKSPRLNTWHFLDKIYHDKRISSEENGIKMVTLYRNYYGNITRGIDSDWINHLRTKILSKLDFLNGDDCDLICGIIKEHYCD